MRLWYAVAYMNNGNEEYMRETHGSDCFTDDLGHALLWENESDVIEHLEQDLYIACVEEDEEGGLLRVDRFKEKAKCYMCGERDAVASFLGKGFCRECGSGIKIS